MKCGAIYRCADIIAVDLLAREHAPFICDVNCVAQSSCGDVKLVSLGLNIDISAMTHNSHWGGAIVPLRPPINLRVIFHVALPLSRVFLLQFKSILLC